MTIYMMAKVRGLRPGQYMRLGLHGNGLAEGKFDNFKVEDGQTTIVLRYRGSYAMMDAAAVDAVQIGAVPFWSRNIIY